MWAVPLPWIRPRAVGVICRICLTRYHSGLSGVAAFPSGCVQMRVSPEANEGIEPAIVSANEFAGRGRVFPATQSGLRTQRLAQGLIGEQWEGGIMAETIGIIGILVAGHDLVHPLPQQRQAGVPNRAPVEP